MCLITGEISISFSGKPSQPMGWGYNGGSGSYGTVLMGSGVRLLLDLFRTPLSMVALEA